MANVGFAVVAGGGVINPLERSMIEPNVVYSAERPQNDTQVGLSSNPFDPDWVGRKPTALAGSLRWTTSPKDDTEANHRRPTQEGSVPQEGSQGLIVMPNTLIKAWHDQDL